MDLGDFFVQFMDLAEDEMKKNMDGILSDLVVLTDGFVRKSSNLPPTVISLCMTCLCTISSFTK